MQETFVFLVSKILSGWNFEFPLLGVASLSLALSLYYRHMCNS